MLGHEAVGVVEDPNGTALEAGQIVAATVRRRPNGVDNEYFARGEPDMAPAGKYVERGIVGADGFMAEYFTSPADALVPVPDEYASLGFLVEPISISEKALEHALASRAAFDWHLDTGLVLGNGSLGLITLAMLEASEIERTYCLGRRDRPDPTIEMIEELGGTYIDSRETPVSEVAAEYEGMDLVYEPRATRNTPSRRSTRSRQTASASSSACPTTGTLRSTAADSTRNSCFTTRRYSGPSTPIAATSRLPSTPSRSCPSGSPTTSSPASTASRSLITPSRPATT